MRPSPLRHPARAAGASLLRLQSDERLIELARAGHDAAFDAIVVRYRAALTRYCAGIVGPDRADDAVQHTLINAHDALQRTDEVRHLRSWLYRIAHNVSLNVLRGVRDDVSLDDAHGSGTLIADGPAAEFEKSEQFRATVAALSALPERQRAALVLRELEGRSHEEIAAALGVTKGSARQHLMRARITMRGAVTAITPYPLVMRLADLTASSGGGAGWSEAVTGAGVGATLTKLTAGVAATGALVGGATVGTNKVVHGGHDGSSARAAEIQRPRAGGGAGQPSAAPPAHAEPVVAATVTRPRAQTQRTTAAERRRSSRAKRRRHGSSAPDHGATTVAPVATPVPERGDDTPPSSSGSGPGSHGDGDPTDNAGKIDNSGPGKSTNKVESRRGKREDEEASGRRGPSGEDASGSGRSQDSSGPGPGGAGRDGATTTAPTAVPPPAPTTTTPTTPATTVDNSGPGSSGSGDSGSSGGDDSGSSGFSGSGSSGSGDGG